jgi:catechol 2,3-dioxygenase-like lactoylglutathione lyase family enzyme
MMVQPPSGLRLTCIGLTTAHLSRAVAFYTHGLGFMPLDHTRLAAGVVQRVHGVAGAAERVILTLGSTWLELLQFDTPGQMYPEHATAVDLVFQHFAMVVDDMQAALDRLVAGGEFTPISRGGPQTLPASSGGVTAFKFRDPDGHPLEFLVLPKRPAVFAAQTSHYGPRRYVDHSAFCATDEARSRDFYRGLGFPAAERSINTDPSQSRLDGTRTPPVTVQVLRGDDEPHLELLCYRQAPQPPLRQNANDVAATRLLFGTAMAPHADTTRLRVLHDPDGHKLVVPIYVA